MDGARDSSNDYEGTLVVSPETETEYWYPVKVVSATYCEPRTFSPLEVREKIRDSEDDADASSFMS